MNELAFQTVPTPKVNLRNEGHKPWTIMAKSLGMVAAVAIVDYITGEEISVTLLYLVPVCWSAWFSGRGAALFIAGASAIAWLVADMLDRVSTGHPIVMVWNMLMLAGIYAIVAFLLASLKQVKDNLETTVEQRTAKLREEVAERRLAENQLRRANVELQNTQEQLIEAAKMEAVGRMAAGVAHEVKNPLMTLGMGAEYFLQRKAANADEVTLLQDMKEAVKRASNIINLMLDFSKPRPLELVPGDLNDIVDSTLKLVRHQLLKHRIDVIRRLQDGLPMLPLDRTRLEHVLINLFSNAIQAMTEGGTLIVRTTLKTASGASDEAASYVMLEVEDTGHGIPPEHLSKVFEPFFTTKPPGQGTGLGLSIVSRIMQIQGGTITLGNRPEGGARATLTFSLKPKTEP